MRAFYGYNMELRCGNGKVMSYLLFRGGNSVMALNYYLEEVIFQEDIILLIYLRHQRLSRVLLSVLAWGVCMITCGFSLASSLNKDYRFKSWRFNLCKKRLFIPKK